MCVTPVKDQILDTLLLSAFPTPVGETKLQFCLCSIALTRALGSVFVGITHARDDEISDRRKSTIPNRTI